MDIRDLIESRRAYRSFEKFKITENLITDLAECAQLAPSCFNNQPWRFVFVYDPDALKELHTAISKGNEWVFSSSLIIAVFSRKDTDCVIKEREYYLFDVGMASAFMILRATELGLVAHPIAGFDEEKAKQALNIPPEMRLITLINIGRKSNELSPVLSDYQKETELKRPDRKPLKEFAFMNKYTAI